MGSTKRKLKFGTYPVSLIGTHLLLVVIVVVGVDTCSASGFCEREKDVDYYGFNLGQPIYGTHIDFCEKKCMKTEKCEGYIFSYGACYFKTRLTNKQFFKGSTAGKCRRDPGLCKKEKDVDYFGGDLGNPIFDVTTDFCEKTCVKTLGCIGYVYFYDTCYLKSNMTHRQDFKGSMAGICRTKPDHCEKQENKAYVGYTLKTISYSDINSCEKSCIDMDQCAGYVVSYDPWNRYDCRLKSHMEGGYYDSHSTSGICRKEFNDSVSGYTDEGLIQPDLPSLPQNVPIDNPGLTLPRKSASKKSAPKDTMPKDSRHKNSVPKDTTPKASAPKDTQTKDSTPKNSTLKDTTPKNSAPNYSVPKDTTTKDSSPKNSVPKDTTTKDIGLKNSTPKDTTTKDSGLKNSTPKDTTTKESGLKNSTPKDTTPKKSGSKHPVQHPMRKELLPRRRRLLGHRLL